MARTYLSPGVYVEDVDRGPKPIEGVSTSVAGFIGFAEKGPVNEATLVTSWPQFEETFGGFVPGAFLPYSVHGYFYNGGETCYILRLPTHRESALIEAPQSRACVELPARHPGIGPSLLVSAKGEGEAGTAISVEICDAEGDSFTLIVRSGTEEEIFTGVTLVSHGETSVVTVNQRSGLIRIEVLESNARWVERIPVPGVYRLAHSRMPAIEHAAVSATTFTGDATARKGIGGLEVIEEITMLCAPDLMSAYCAGAIDDAELRMAQLSMIAHCENMGDRIAILDTPPGLTPRQAATWRVEEAGYDSAYAALYYPWIEALDVTGRPLMLPPSGHVAGIYARVDANYGVHKAPANELLDGALGLGTKVTKADQDLLNPMGVNCIAEFPGRGIRVWGARLLSSNPAWRYINVRRLFNYVEESIREGTQWAVFEPNDPFVWGQVARDVSAFLRTVWLGGALRGDTPDEAFYVKCDEELNPPKLRDQGQLIIEVGLAPAKPAEFIVFRISQWAGGAAGGV